MFNRSKIMSDAWVLYRRNFTSYSRPANKEACRRCWKAALRNAWIWAKQEVAEATKSAEHKATERLTILKAELMRFDARPWGMRSYRITGDRAVIQAEISSLRTQVSQ